MKVLVTSTNEEDPIKIEGATVAKTLNINFSNTQGQAGQLTPQSRVELAEIQLIQDVMLSLLLSRMKKI